MDKYVNYSNTSFCSRCELIMPLIAIRCTKCNYLVRHKAHDGKTRKKNNKELKYY